LALTLLIGTSTSVVGTAGAITLTFDEVPFQSVDGLTVQGVTFDFKIDGTDSSDAFYNSFGPLGLTTIEGASLEGDSTGILTLQFAVPTPILRFGAALNTGDALSPGFRVELFNASDESLGITPVDTTPAAGALGFSEAWFDHSGTPIVRAVVDFADDPGRFAMDNLTYVPEPTTLAIAVVALLALAACRPMR
jgi:hypothetical protein